MNEQLVIVKVGGSLFDWPELGIQLDGWLRTLRPAQIVLVPGGGPAADVIRDMDRIHGLGEESSHVLALHSLNLMAHTLFEVLAPIALPNFIAWPPQWQELPQTEKKLAVLDPFGFSVWDEASLGFLPHSWDVTSDSIAARVAEVMNARELILLKSVTVPPEMDWTEASRRGFVDGYFPTIIARGVRVRAVNLREWRA